MKPRNLLLIALAILIFSAIAFSQDKTGTVVMATDTTVSASFNVPTGHTLTGINVPDTLTASTTELYLLVSIDGVTFDTLYHDNALYKETIVATGCNLTLKYPAVFNWSKFKIAVNTEQTGARTFRVNYSRKF